MANFFAELKRRHIYRVAAAYAVVAWVLLQLFNNVAPIVELPPWVGRVVLIILLLGLPVTLLSVWLQQLTPAGGPTPSAATKNLDFALIGALIVVIGLVAYQLVPSTGVGTAQQTNIASSTLAPQSAGISIAVLPFVNLSSDAEQEFFSDGMTEEITSALSKIPALRVVARTSAFQFKGQNQDLRVVGQALGTTHLIEGSVRTVGDRVRITAQLIKVEDGTHLWTENYDRELTEIFTIQEDIARAITGALRVPLGLAPGASLVSNRAIDSDSYEQYLRAKALVRGRTVVDAIKLLEPVVVHDAGYAPAWALLARAYELVPAYDPALLNGSLEAARRLVQFTGDKAEKSAQEAVRLDSRNADGYGVLAYIEMQRGKWASAEDLYKRALALDANEPEVLQAYSIYLAIVGRLKEALSIRERLRTLEPFVPIYNIMTAEIMQLNGQSQASISILEATPAAAAGGYRRNVYLAQAYALEGRYSEAADILLATPPQILVRRRSVEDAARLIRSAHTKASAPEALPTLEGDLSFVYTYVGVPDRVLDYQERLVELNYVIATGSGKLWSPEYAPLRKTERFKAMMRKSGLVDYWRARGWPEFCHPTTGDDFACE